MSIVIERKARNNGGLLPFFEDDKGRVFIFVCVFYSRWVLLFLVIPVKASSSSPTS